MSVVKINALEVPPSRAEVLEARFAARAEQLTSVDGFESFQLLRPTQGMDRYLVVSTWRDEEAFQKWTASSEFAAGHARSASDDGPAATGSELWGFEVVVQAES